MKAQCLARTAGAALAAVSIGLAAPVAAEGGLNAIISGDTAATGAMDSTDVSEPGQDIGAAPERWITSTDPTGNLRVITIRPLPGETCAEVLLEHRPNQRLRLEPRAGETLELALSDLCALGLRNDAEDRTLAVRLGEGLRTAAITSDTRLYAGLPLGPGHEILTPLRPIPMTELIIEVETAWDDALEGAAPERFRIRLSQSLN